MRLMLQAWSGWSDHFGELQKSVMQSQLRELQRQKELQTELLSAGASETREDLEARESRPVGLVARDLAMRICAQDERLANGHADSC